MNRYVSKIVVVAVACLPFVATAVSWTNKTVGRIQATYNLANCIYFTLDGVTEADPVMPGVPWFAIPRTQYGAQDGYAALLAAKMAGTEVQVNTNGTTACGYALATEVILH